MGCDIHAFVEVKVNDTWHTYAKPRIKRRYDLFEKMAGVRGDVENAMVAPRGLPQDVALVTKIEADSWGEDGHTYSWLSCREVADLIGWMDRKMKKLCPDEWYSFEHMELGYIGGNGWDSFVAGSQSYPRFDDVRLVFWFDN